VVEVGWKFVLASLTVETSVACH